MYQLLVRYHGWQPAQDEMSSIRTFEYTERDLVAQFKPNGELDVAQLTGIPALLIAESGGKGSQYARLGRILSVRSGPVDYVIRYAFDDSLPVIENRRLERLAPVLGIHSDEFHRTHWAIKK